MAVTVYTIGHSTQSVGSFLGLLEKHGITAVADVRSDPYSRIPDYNRDALKELLRERGIAYVFLGRELGARPRDDAMYEGNQVRYERLASTPRFAIGLERIAEGARQYRVTLLCAEGDPLNCHRSLLVGRSLVENGFQVAHIRTDGRLETQEEAMERLLGLHQLPQRDVFGEQAHLIELARVRQEGRIAFRRGRVPADRQ